MPVLLDKDRQELLAQQMQRKSAARSVIPLDKSEYRAAINATDDSFDGIMAAVDAALPAKARRDLTPVDKIEMLVAVANKRREEAARG